MNETTTIHGDDWSLVLGSEKASGCRQVWFYLQHRSGCPAPQPHATGHVQIDGDVVSCTWYTTSDVVRWWSEHGARVEARLAHALLEERQAFFLRTTLRS